MSSGFWDLLQFYEHQHHHHLDSHNIHSQYHN